MEISLKAQQLFSIGNFDITNSLFLTLIVSLLLITFAIIFRRKVKLVPGKIQGAIEMLMEFFLGLMESTLGSVEEAEKYLPLVITIFIFILVSNWLGLLPGVGSLMYNSSSGAVPLFRSPAADLNFTLAFAITSVLVTNFMGIFMFGIFKFIKKFLNLSSPLNFFVGVLEFVSEVSKIISLTFRLFGNIFAGEVLLSIMFFLLPCIVPMPFIALEIFFGMIQAFIFSMLTLVFLALNTAETEHSH